MRHFESNFVLKNTDQLFFAGNVLFWADADLGTFLCWKNVRNPPVSRAPLFGNRCPRGHLHILPCGKNIGGDHPSFSCHFLFFLPSPFLPPFVFWRGLSPIARDDPASAFRLRMPWRSIPKIHLGHLSPIDFPPVFDNIMGKNSSNYVSRAWKQIGREHTYEIHWINPVADPIRYEYQRIISLSGICSEHGNSSTRKQNCMAWQASDGSTLLECMSVSA